MEMLHSPSSADAMLADMALMSGGRDATPLARHLFVLTGDAPFLDLLRETLEEDGYRVTATAFTPATFAAIAASQPALVLLDLATRERLGWALLERLHDEATTRAIPVVVASTQRGYLARAWDDVARYGSLAVLEMPFDIDDLLAVVRAALARAAACTRRGGPTGLDERVRAPRAPGLAASPGVSATARSAGGGSGPHRGRSSL